MSGVPRAAESARSEVRHRWLETAELEGRREEWRQLARESVMPTAYGDPGWLLPWWRTYGVDADPWWLALEDGDGRLRGLAALALTRRRGVRTLTFAAQEWNGIDMPLCRPADEERLVDELLDALAVRAAEWDALRVRRLPAASLLCRRLLEGARPLRAVARDVRLQPYIRLPADVEAFEATFSSKQRNTQRRKWRRLQRLGAEPRLISDPEEIAPAVRRLIELRRARAIAMGQRHGHMDQRFERFMTEAIRELLPDGARLWTLELGDETLAMRLNVAQGPREHSYLLGLSDLHHALSPGSGIERHAILEAIKAGRTEFDLGPGRHEYKYRLGGVDREMTELVVPSPTARGQAVGRLAAIDVHLRASGLASRVRERRGVLDERATARRPRVG